MEFYILYRLTFAVPLAILHIKAIVNKVWGSNLVFNQSTVTATEDLVDPVGLGEHGPEGEREASCQ